MLNIEFYKEDIVALSETHGSAIGVSKHTHKPVYCNNINCYDCEIHKVSPNNCALALYEWFATEYNAHPLTREEKNILSYFKEIFTKSQCKKLKIYRPTSDTLYLSVDNTTKTYLPINSALFNRVGVHGAIALIDLFKEAGLWEEEEND